MSLPNEFPALPRSRGHWRLISKIVVSFVGFLVAFGLSQLVPSGEQGDLIWSIGASLFVAGIVFIAQYLFEVEQRLDTMESTVRHRVARLERTVGQRLDTMEDKFDHHVARTAARLDAHAEDTERQLTEGFSKIHLATELFSLREAAQLKPEEMAEMTKLVRSSTRITSETPPLVHEFAQAEIARLADYLKKLGDGSDVTYEGEDRDWLLGLTRVAQKSLQATSLTTVDGSGHSTDGGLWGSELGLTYLAEQELAIRRGVRIQRIFIIDRQGHPLEVLRDVLERHISIGVEVRVLDATGTPGIVQQLRDFIIFDEVLSYQSTTAIPMGNIHPMVVNTTVVTSSQRLVERRRDFDTLWNHDKVNVVTMNNGDKIVFTPASTAAQVDDADPLRT